MGCLDILPHSCQSPSEMPFSISHCAVPTMFWPEEEHSATKRTLALLFSKDGDKRANSTSIVFNILGAVYASKFTRCLLSFPFPVWIHSPIGSNFIINTSEELLSHAWLFLLEANHRIFESWCWKISQFKCSRIRCSKKINCEEFTSDLLAWLPTPNHTETRNHPSLTEPLSRQEIVPV